MVRNGCTCWLLVMETVLPLSPIALSIAWPRQPWCGPAVTGKQLSHPSAQLWVVVQIPLNAQVADGLEAQARSDGERLRASQEGRSAQIQGGIEDVAPAGDQRPPKLGSM